MIKMVHFWRSCSKSKNVIVFFGTQCIFDILIELPFERSQMTVNESVIQNTKFQYDYVWYLCICVQYVLFFTMWRSNANAVLGVVILTVSVTPVLCDKMKEHKSNILIPNEWAISLVFWHQQQFADDVSFHLKFAPEVTPLRKSPTLTGFSL